MRPQPPGVDALRRRLVVAAGVGMTLIPVLPVQAEERVVHVVARKFVFEPEKIALTRNQPVRLEFTAPEVPMGFACADLGLRTVIVPGQVAVLNFTPERAGRFEFACDVFCGSGHEEMSGAIEVSG